MTEEKKIPELKVILLGEAAVGKTSIIRRFYDETFDFTESSTISMSYVDKIVELDGKKYKLYNRTRIISNSDSIIFK